MLETLLVTVPALISLAYLGGYAASVATQLTVVTLLWTALTLWYLLRRPKRWPVWPLLPAAVGCVYALISGTAWPAASALILLMLTAVAVAVLPLRRLPLPPGRHRVSSMEARCDIETAKGEHRTLRLKIWYPCTALMPAVSLWHEFETDSSYPAVLRYCFGYLRYVRTATSTQAPLSAERQKWPVILYNHGLLSFASETSVLLEALCSHGFIVIAIEHREQAQEYRRLSRELEAVKAPGNAALLRRLKSHPSKEERAELSSRLFLNSPVTAEIVQRRSADTLSILDELSALLAAIPGAEAGTGAAVVSVMGYSVGGAVATRLATLDKRFAGSVNIDGGLYGVDTDSNLVVPYLMLYSAQNEAANDRYLAAKGDRVRQRTLAGTTHLSFHDIAVIAPLLCWFGLFGRHRPTRMRSQLLDELLDFLPSKEDRAV